MHNILNQSQIKSIVKIAIGAGKIAMSYFGRNNLMINRKSDNSPFTIADSLISQLIFSHLQKITPNISIICEEGENRDFGDGVFWLIDPIDGTSSFINNNPEFTINIALIQNKKPIFGLIFAPAIEKQPLYYTNIDGSLMQYLVDNKKEKIFVANKQKGRCSTIITSKRSSDRDILDCFASHFYGENAFCDIQIKLDPSFCEQDISILKVSSSLKFLYLIDGKANLYLHLRRSMEWDIAAGQALLLAAGGRIVNFNGSEFLYQKADLTNQPFIATVG